AAITSRPMRPQRKPSATAVSGCEAKLLLADASLSSIRQLGSSASVPLECAPITDSDWHDQCVTHRDSCEHRLVDVEMRPHELVKSERQPLTKRHLHHAIAPKRPEEPQRRRTPVHDVMTHRARHVTDVTHLVIEGAGVPIGIEHPHPRLSREEI